MSNKKCPFRKTISYEQYYTYGTVGVPMPVALLEKFDDCIGEECMAYKTKYDIEFASPSPRKITYCYLCGKDPN